MSDPLIGKTIGAYRIDEELGQSRWGKIYRAWQESVHRMVAVKVLSPEIAAEPGKVDQFCDEARAAAQLSHENLVAVYEAGYDEGVHFCAMELIDSPPLAEFLRKDGSVDEHRLLLTIAGVARALDFLWQRKIPHQAVVIKNILASSTGAVKLINIEPEGLPPMQSQQEDIAALGLALGQVANDISAVSKPVSELVERMVRAEGRKPFTSLAELTEEASALDHKLFRLPRPVLAQQNVQSKKLPLPVVVGAAVLGAGAIALLCWLLLRGVQF